MKITPFDYHDDESKHGSYQYITLKEFVNRLLRETLDSDSYIKNTSRTKILDETKDCIRSLYREVFKDPRAIEITVPETLYFALPHDYVDFIRVSKVLLDETTNSYRLVPIEINTDINIADGYLQDHNYEILFDEDGGILTADATNTYAVPHKKYLFEEGVSIRTKDTSKLSRYGEVIIDEERGKMAFSSDLADKEIVFEYLTDGLVFDKYGEEEIKIHKDAIEVMKAAVYFAIIERRATVPQVEKTRALLRFKTTKHEAKKKKAGFSAVLINKAMRSSSKNI